MPSKVILKSKFFNHSVPAAQALQYTIERALQAITWLRETEEERERKYNAGEDGYITGERSRILADIISVYTSTLVEKGGSGHSLLKSYVRNDFVKKFIALPIVGKCIMNRHNRSAHEAKSYGYFVSPKEILNSDLESWLNEAQFFLVIFPEKNKTNYA